MGRWRNNISPPLDSHSGSVERLDQATSTDVLVPRYPADPVRSGDRSVRSAPAALGSTGTLNIHRHFLPLVFPVGTALHSRSATLASLFGGAGGDHHRARRVLA